MMRQVAVLRPEPGNTSTADRVLDAGMVPLRLPLFETVAVPWMTPDATRFDAILMTSAAAARLGGLRLDALLDMPVVAVGAATAVAARIRGFTVAVEGSGGIDHAIVAARDAGYGALLHLAARDHVDAAVAQRVVVYASEPLSVAPSALAALDGQVALLHSVRAARRLAALLPDLRRSRIRIAAISDAVGEAAGSGWNRVDVAPSPDDDTLVALARSLAIDRPGARGDKTP